MASSKIDVILKRNRAFAESEGHLPRVEFWDAIPDVRAERRGITVVACCDPRLDLKRILGVVNGKHDIPMWIIQNAGGRVFSALATVAATQAVSNPSTIIVIHHNDCGMAHVRDDEIKQKLLEIAPEDKNNIEASQFGELTTSPEESLKQDVTFLRNSSWIQKDVNIVGLKYDMDTGLLEQVV